jgi:hypothetical protein
VRDADGRLAAADAAHDDGRERARLRPWASPTRPSASRGWRGTRAR